MGTQSLEAQQEVLAMQDPLQSWNPGLQEKPQTYEDEHVTSAFATGAHCAGAQQFPGPRQTLPQGV
jgi:hypothetical protein